MTCPCDRHPPPGIPAIAAGLSALPRQIGSFAEFRAAMLALVPAAPALRDWRARAPADFGIMLIELAAYLGESLAFYDQVIADESYLATAGQRRSLRRLVSLIGYRPRPAVGARAELALLADGTGAVTVPAGTGFRSGAFDGEPPQVFEASGDAVIHPAANRLAVAPARAGLLSGRVGELLVAPESAALAEGDLLLIELSPTATHVRRAARIGRTVDAAGDRLVRVELDRPIVLPEPVPVAAVRVRKPTRLARLRVPSRAGEPPPFGQGNSSFTVARAMMFASIALPGAFWWFVLDGVHSDLSRNDRFLVSLGDDVRWLSVQRRTEVDRIAVPAQTLSQGGTTINVPPVLGRFTEVTTGDDPNQVERRPSPTSPIWTANDAADLRVHYALVDAGRVVAPALAELPPISPIPLVAARAPATEVPRPSRFALRDAEARAVAVDGTLDWAAALLRPDQVPRWAPPLRQPVELFANLVEVSRGESVAGEVLGSGDGSIAGQTFTLAKKPLTYLPDPRSDSGVRSTLRIRVDGLEWTEVPSFYRAAADARVFVVRHDDDGAAAIHFGDGARGARLPSSVDNVVAWYRFGAGAKSPPAGSIVQIVRSVAGLRSVVQPLAAAGGADAEPAESIRTLAPGSALLLGRAVSLPDMQVAARAVPGVVDAAAEWFWERSRQRRVVKVWFIGPGELASTIRNRLRALSDPATPIDVGPAEAVPVALALDIATDPRRDAARVVRAVRERLLDPADGLLAPARVGIGRGLFRSRIFAAVLAVPGAAGVRGLHWSGAPLSEMGQQPGPGRYFDFGGGRLAVTGSEVRHG